MDVGLIDVSYSLDYTEGKATPTEVIDWGVQVAKWADEYGLSAAYFAEHYTVGREVSPAPDLMIAAASQVTQNITLGALGHLLPYHNPIALAYRMLWLDHMTRGRYLAGVAPGAFPTDAQLFSTRDQNLSMMMEALDIIDAIWRRQGPWRIDGQYWTADMPAYSEQWHGPHLKPFQQPAPRLAMTGRSRNSGTLKLAGQRGYVPVSQQVGVEALQNMWETYSTAATQAGHVPNRADWHVVREWFVADTDQEAREAILNGEAADLWREHNHPLFSRVGLTADMASVPAEAMTAEWMIENFWLVGSPETVARKIATFQEETGGFGTLIGIVYDCRKNPEPFRRSIELMGTEVMPWVADLGPTRLAATS